MTAVLIFFSQHNNTEKSPERQVFYHHPSSIISLSLILLLSYHIHSIKCIFILVMARGFTLSLVYMMKHGYGACDQPSVKWMLQVVAYAIKFLWQYVTMIGLKRQKIFFTEKLPKRLIGKLRLFVVADVVGVDFNQKRL